MKGFLPVILLFTILCLLAGCTEYWYQEGKTFEECQQDRKECLDELTKRSELYRVGDYELRFMEDCMKARGYRLLSEDKLPLELKRQKAIFTNPRLRGIAGTVKED